MKSALIILVTFSAFTEGLASSWNYQEEGPSTWAESYPDYCNGSSQSPIDINHWEVSPNPCDLSFVNYDLPFSGYWKNNGHALQFTLDDGSGAVVSGPCLGNSTYQLLQVHFHWGSAKGQGSEHTIEGKQHDLEMHMVHTNTAYETDEAANYKDGYLVVGVLFDEAKRNKIRGFGQTFRNFVKKSSKLQDSDEGTLTAMFDVSDILRKSGVARSHFQYSGSLTTPSCNEVVTWILATKILKEKRSELNALRSLQTHDDEALVDNFRPTQELNGRKIMMF